jgi:hypothetical protein
MYHQANGSEFQAAFQQDRVARLGLTEYIMKYRRLPFDQTMAANTTHERHLGAHSLL